MDRTAFFNALHWRCSTELESTDHAQRALDRLLSAVVQFGIFLIPSKCKVQLQDRTTAASNLIPDREEPTFVDGLTHLGSSKQNDGNLAVDGSTRISKA